MNEEPGFDVVRASQFAAIDQEAESKKNTVLYFIQLAEKHYPVLRDWICSHPTDYPPEQNLEEALFHLVRSVVFSLDRFVLPSSAQHPMDLESSLGLVTPTSSSSFGLTPEGQKAYGNYRLLAGLSSLEELRQSRLDHQKAFAQSLYEKLNH